MKHSSAEYGSDYIVELLRELGIRYAAFNPGATFRGIHESLLNFGSDGPEIIEACHEEISVAIAHGYARATGEPMAAILHDVVGLQHASMAIYNAWVDRVPMLLLGGTGPMDTTRRRPAYIEWAHTALIQGNIVRDYVKFDDQPASIAAVPESLFNAYRLMMSEPRGPVYVCFDVSTQEEHTPAELALPDVARFARSTRLQADPAALAQLAEWLVEARHPVIYAGWLGRHADATRALTELADTLAAPVLCSDNRFNMATNHPLNLTGLDHELVPQADLILALDAWDLQQPLNVYDAATGASRGLLAPDARLAQISLRDLIVRSWAQDYQALTPTDLFVTADTSLALPELLRLVRARLAAEDTRANERGARAAELHTRHAQLRARWAAEAEALASAQPISPALIALEVGRAMQGEDWSLTHNSHNPWPLRLWDFEQAHQYLTGHMGGGIGFGLGVSIGAALGFRDSGRLCIDLQPDGDLLYTPAALWTLAHYRLPVLIVMYNNRSLHNSAQHVGQVALHRHRPVERAGVGSELNDPVVDFARVAQGFGIWAEGPVERPEDLRAALARAVQIVKHGRPALLDVVTQPR
jgi:acetolactate synthase-1/2/3 large subunit